MEQQQQPVLNRILGITPDVEALLHGQLEAHLARMQSKHVHVDGMGLTGSASRGMALFDQQAVLQQHPRSDTILQDAFVRCVYRNYTPKLETQI